MNELMICFGNAGWAYHQTDCETLFEAVIEFFNCMMGMNINVDNLHYTEAVLRDENGDGIEQEYRTK